MDKNKAKKELTTLLSKIYPKDSNIFEIIKKQAEQMVKDTINSMKYDFRPLNRHNDNYKGCFNLLAYDSLLDSTGNLWLIEINRGPDLKGLEANIGYDKSVEFFDEIFKLTLDNHYTDKIFPEVDIKNWKRIFIDYKPINLDLNC